jgi:hypothetical protein
VRISWKARTRGVLTAAAAVGFLASSALVWQSSRAAFTASTDNTGNNWSAGTVTLTDNGSSSTLFDATDLKAGSAGSSCVNVSYRGTVDATVKLYGSVDGSLAPYVDVTVEAGAAGCAGSLAPVYSGTLAGLAATAGSYANGVGSWAPAGRSGAQRGYRFSWRLRDDNAAQGLTAASRFTWEAHSA